MADVLLEEIHGDLEVLKKDVAEIKRALFGDEGILSPWAMERIDSYLKKGHRGFVSQSEVENEFL